MKMYAIIQFDRPIDKEKHCISPGGYEMTFSNGVTTQFDFMEFEGSVDEQDDTVLFCTMRRLDTDTFPDADFLRTFEGSVTDIKEFYVWTGTHGDPEIYPTRLIYLMLRNDDDVEITVDEKLLNEVHMLYEKWDSVLGMEVSNE